MPVPSSVLGVWRVTKGRDSHQEPLISRGRQTQRERKMNVNNQAQLVRAEREPMQVSPCKEKPIPSWGGWGGEWAQPSWGEQDAVEWRSEQGMGWLGTWTRAAQDPHLNTTRRFLAGRRQGRGALHQPRVPWLCSGGRNAASSLIHSTNCSCTCQALT